MVIGFPLTRDEKNRRTSRRFLVETMSFLEDKLALLLYLEKTPTSKAIPVGVSNKGHLPNGKRQDAKLFSSKGGNHRDQ